MNVQLSLSSTDCGDEKTEICSSGTNCAGIRRPCECEQHDLLRNTKRRAHRGESCSQSISISEQKHYRVLEILISQCQQPQHMNRRNQLYVTFTLSKKFREKSGTNLGVKPSEWLRQCPGVPRS